MIELYSAGTPNGWKASIALAEMGLEHELHALDFGKQEQKEAWYLKINPNGRIPAIIDKDNDDFAVFESGAILWYLAEKSGKFLPKEPNARSVVHQWLMFQMGGVGPMQGQANAFLFMAPEKMPWAIDRYKNETRRLYEVLDRRLGEGDYLAGDYSIADMATYPWVLIHGWAEVSLEGLDSLAGWLKRVGSRPAVQEGMKSPLPSDPKRREALLKLLGSD